MLVAADLSLSVDKKQCKSCVEDFRGCTYCQDDGRLTKRDRSKCVCDSFDSGFFGNCNDFVHTSYNYVNKWDCTFDTESGVWVLVAVIVVPIFVFLAAGMFIERCMRKARARDLSGMNRDANLHDGADE